MKFDQSVMLEVPIKAVFGARDRAAGSDMDRTPAWKYLAD